jgi:hypothetical protein
MSIPQLHHHGPQSHAQQQPHRDSAEELKEHTPFRASTRGTVPTTHTTSTSSGGRLSRTNRNLLFLLLALTSFVAILRLITYPTLAPPKAAQRGGPTSEEELESLRKKLDKISAELVEAKEARSVAEVRAAAALQLNEKLRKETEVENRKSADDKEKSIRSRKWTHRETKMTKAEREVEDEIARDLIANGAVVVNPERQVFGPRHQLPGMTVQALFDGEWIPTPEPLLNEIPSSKITDLERLSPCLKRRSKPEFRNPSSNATAPLLVRKRVHFCTIVRNRVKSLVEWILWHRILGVDLFHIFDDDSDDGLQEALKPFVEVGIVKLEPRPSEPFRFMGRWVPGPQLKAQDMCFEFAREYQADHQMPPGSVWVGQLDSDEFFLTPHCIPEWLSILENDIHREQAALAEGRRKGDRKEGDKAPAKDRVVGGNLFGAVAIGWAMIGHDGEFVDRNRTIFEATHFQQGELNDHYKSIVRADVVHPFTWMTVTPHGFQLNKPYETFFQDHVVSGMVRTKPANEHYLLGFALLGHYKYRSLASTVQRAIDGGADDVNRVLSLHLRDLMSTWNDWRRRGYTAEVSKGSNIREGPLYDSLQSEHGLLLQALGW